MRLKEKKKTYSIKEYKENAHPLRTEIKVKSKKGTTFNIYRDRDKYFFGFFDKHSGYTYCMRHKNGECRRTTKTGVINYLKKN